MCELSADSYSTDSFVSSSNSLSISKNVDSKKNEKKLKLPHLVFDDKVQPLNNMMNSNEISCCNINIYHNKFNKYKIRSMKTDIFWKCEICMHENDTNASYCDVCETDKEVISDINQNFGDIIIHGPISPKKESAFSEPIDEFHYLDKDEFEKVENVVANQAMKVHGDDSVEILCQKCSTKDTNNIWYCSDCFNNISTMKTCLKCSSQYNEMEIVRNHLENINTTSKLSSKEYLSQATSSVNETSLSEFADELTDRMKLSLNLKYWKCNNKNCGARNSIAVSYCRSCGLKKYELVTLTNMFRVRQNSSERKMWFCSYCKTFSLPSTRCSTCSNLRYFPGYKHCSCNWVNLHFQRNCFKCKQRLYEK